MKKILVIIIAVCFALCLSGCSIFATRESDLPYTTDRAAEGDTSYSALNISVAAEIQSKDNGEHVTLYTIGVSFMGGILVEDDVLYAMDKAAKDLGIFLEPLTYETVDKGRNLGDGYYDYYTFLVHREYAYPLSYSDSDYGFFYARHSYSMNSPAWINQVRESVFNRFNSVFNAKIAANRGLVKIDPECVRLRYYLVGDKLEAEGATKVKYGNTVNSIMWEVIGDEYDFEQLTVTQKVMMEGWDIVPIILGSIVVLVLFAWWAIAKMLKKPNDGSEIFVINDNQSKGRPNYDGAKNDPFDREFGLDPQDNGKSAVVENQISMDEFTSALMEEPDGKQ